MNQPVSINPQDLVCDLLQRWPQASIVFLQNRMGCVGCSMSGFDTLEDVTKNYQMDLDELIRQVQAAIENASNR